MKTKRLNILDASWLYVESQTTPMQVGGLLIFQIPENAPESFVGDIVTDFRAATEVYPPWNRRLMEARLRTLAPRWVEDDDVDLDYHLRHSALPKPGGERELGTLISRLHSRPMDFRRPPWECHIIEGLENNRFAVYIKIHHALIDGVSGMRILARSLPDRADDIDRLPFWAIKPPAKNRVDNSAAPASVGDALRTAFADIIEQAKNIPQVVRVARVAINATRNKTDALRGPFDTPKSILNGRITGNRRYATQLYSLKHIRQLAEAAGCTVNDVFLALCGAALHRFLDEIDALPKKSLTAGIPVSVRPSDDQEAGNAITFIIASMGTNIADPKKRLEAIAESTRRSKGLLRKLPASAITSYTLGLMGPYIMSLITGLAGRTRPVFNITVSNVPGPEKPLYIKGARMEAFYPSSLVTHGQALNITCHGYEDTLGIGLVGCRETLPHMQKLAEYMGEALAELDSIYLPGKNKKATDK